MSKKQTQNTWSRIGFYPTPENLVDQFATVVDNFIRKEHDLKEIFLLDLFAGDGRLGKETFLKLTSEGSKISQLTYSEIEEDQIALIDRKTGKPSIFRRNIFTWQTKKKFNLIVSNPPYLMLNSLKSENFGFSWDYVKTHGRNLYTLGILKGLDLCEENGVMAVISPFSWLRGEFSAKFRDEINRRCSEVFIKANDHRTVFKDVNQDIGIQFFVKRRESDNSLTKWKFAYNGNSPEIIDFEDLNKRKTTQINDYRITVGPVVWNRKREYLTYKKKNNILVIYGGNIGHDNKLHFNIPRYREKQYINKDALIKTDVFFSPLILIRRIMRGIPGNWEIDSCLIDKKIICTAENHVIVVEIPLRRVGTFRAFHKELMKRIKDYYYFSGSPSISVKVVKHILSELDQSMPNKVTSKNINNNKKNGAISVTY